MKGEDDLTRYMDKVHIGDDDFFKKGTRSGKLGIPGASTDRANRATQDQVLDPRTRMILLKMINKGTFDELKACLSTGKEANVYRAVVEDPFRQYAVKVYKTAILAFKDRERYVVGEYRFRFGYSRSNPRKMVKLWAEKETRNLKRIWKSDIPVPKPLHLDHHVLVMEFLGTPEGFASPKLKDADIEPERYDVLYMQLVSYMRILYQECRLVHADLSEYNILYHEEKLWIIDVSQSVEHDHPMSLDFLRMDIKNVNDYFSKRGGVKTFGERQLFEFITRPPAQDAEWPEKTVDLIEELKAMPKETAEQLLSDDAVFRKIYIPRNLNEVFDADRDTLKVQDGEQDSLVYGDLLRPHQSERRTDANAQELPVPSASRHTPGPESGNRISIPPSIDNTDDASASDSCNNDEDKSNSNSDDDNDNDESSDSEESDVTDVWTEEWDSKLKARSERKFVDRGANKERKKLAKQEKKEKRATKMKKKDKKRLVAQSKNSHKNSGR